MQSQNMLENAKQPVVIGLGEVLWDCFETGRQPGGAPANVVYHAGQLCLDGRLCSRVGADELGVELLTQLEERNFVLEGIQRDTSHATGTVTVDAPQPDAPSYTIHAPAAWDFLAPTALWRGWLESAAAVCFGTLAQRHPTSRQTIRQALDWASHALCVYDLNFRPPFIERAWVEASLHQADVFKLNQHEVHELNDLLDLGVTSDFVVIARALLDRFNGQYVCITRGAEGSLLVTPDQHAEAPAQPIQVVDAVGAGDAFTAALTYGLLAQWSLEQIGDFANRVGAVVASRRGAMPDIRAELRDLKQQFGGSD